MKEKREKHTKGPHCSLYPTVIHDITVVGLSKLYKKDIDSLISTILTKEKRKTY